MLYDDSQWLFNWQIWLGLSYILAFVLGFIGGMFVSFKKTVKKEAP